MADPTIQTFCCHHANGSDLSVSVMKEFDTDSYNSVCLLSSALGICGAIYQILPREEYSNNHRWLSFPATRSRRIITWLAVADLFAAVGVFVRSTVWINYKNIMPALKDDSSVIFCALTSAWIQYFYTATWIWTLCYAIDIRLILTEREPKSKHYHLYSWLVPAVTTTFGLSLLYFPDANCHTSMSLSSAILRILPNYFATYVPMGIVMIANPCLYHMSTKDMEMIIMSASGQCTTKERDLLDAIKMKFSCINIVFYICWLPNILGGILLWTLWFHLPITSILTIWYIMALVNPLQAFFNTLVYRRWKPGSEKVVFPWKDVQKKFSTSLIRSSQDTVREEIYPLFRKVPVSSVNDLKSYHTL